MRRFAPALVLTLALPGCYATAPLPPRPSGYAMFDGPADSTLRSFACEDDVAECYRRATRACPDGYAVASASAPVRDIAFSRYGVAHEYVGALGSLVVQCDEDIAQPAVRARCDRAWSVHEEVASAWAARRSTVARDDVPESTFLAVCSALPARAQRCLSPGYQRAHAAMCDASMRTLGPTDAAHLDLVLAAARPR